MSVRYFLTWHNDLPIGQYHEWNSWTFFLLFSFGRVPLSHVCYGYKNHDISFLPFKQGTIYVFLQNAVIIIISKTMPGLLKITNTLIQILFIWVLRQICILFWDNRIERYSKFPTQHHVNLLCVICFIKM